MKRTIATAAALPVVEALETALQQQQQANWMVEHAAVGSIKHLLMLAEQDPRMQTRWRNQGFWFSGVCKHRSSPCN